MFITTETLRREEHQDLLTAVLNYHFLKAGATPSIKSVSKEYRMTSRQGIEKHLMGAMAFEWFPVSGNSTSFLLQNDRMHQALHQYVMTTTHDLTREERIAKAWDTARVVTTDTDVETKGEILAAFIDGAAGNDQDKFATLCKAFGNKPNKIRQKVNRHMAISIITITHAQS